MTTEIGCRLVQIRGQKSQASFAQELGVHKNTLGGYERGERKPDSDTLIRLTEAGYNANWVLTGKGPMILVDEAHSAGGEEYPLSIQENHRAGIAFTGTPKSVPSEGYKEEDRGGPVRIEEMEVHFERARKADIEAGTSSYAQTLPIPMTVYVRLVGPLAELAPDDEGHREAILERAISALRALTYDDPVEMLHFQEPDLRNIVASACTAYRIARERRGV